MKCKEIPILAVSHCILNRSTRWWQNGKSINGNIGMNIQILELLSRFKVGLVQMPCPEFTFCGNPRPPRTRDEYSMLPGFVEHCRRLAEETAENLKVLVEKAKKPPVKILAVIGVERSPTCGVKRTPVGRVGDRQYTDGMGLFTDLLSKSLRNVGLDIPFIGADLDRPEELATSISRLIDC